MNLEERMNALFAWMDEPASAGFGTEAARRVLGTEQAAQAEQEAKAAAESAWKTQQDQLESIRETETEKETAAPPEGRTAMQAEYDIAALRRECFGQKAVSSVHSKDLTAVEDVWQARKAVTMTPGQLDLLLRTNWAKLSERQRAEMTALQQCGHVPDREMELFLYTVSTLNELVSSREIRRLQEQISARGLKDEAWRALYNALSARLAVSEEVARRRIDRVEEQLRMREEAYNRAAEAYSRAQADRRRVENSYF